MTDMGICGSRNKSRDETFVVAPGGSDAWSGRLDSPDPSGSDGPKATLSAAVEATRRLGLGTPKRVVVRGGHYFIHEPVILTPQDSGLTIEAAPGENVTLCGGQRITGWERDRDDIWSAPVPATATGPWDFRMLVVNGRFCPRARLPESGFFTHSSEFKVPWMSTTGGGWKRKPTEDELTTLQYRPGDLGDWLDLRNAELTVYHMWDESMVGIRSLDEATRTVRFSVPSGHPPGAFGVQRYVVWNVREGLTKPGQWYLDRSASRVAYWRLPGEDMARAEAFAPLTECILRIGGTEQEPVRGVVLRGLKLHVTNTPLVAGGFGASRFDGALAVQFAENFRIEDVEIWNVGGQGLRVEKSQNVRVEGCDVHDTGACGIIVRGNGLALENNQVHHAGRMYPSAIGLWCSGKDVGVRHNTVHHTPYTGIAASGEDHVYEANRIHRVMEELCDGAAIYITFCKRIVLRGNFVHDIRDAGGYGSSAYYLDEQAEDCVVEGNLAERVLWPSHNHMARNNTVRNNVFLSDGDARLTFPRSTGYAFERNVIQAKGKIVFRNGAAITSMPRNVLFSGTGKVLVEDLADYKGMGERPLEPRDGTLLADPELLDAESGLCRYAPESPVHSLGIEPVDVRGAGPNAPKGE